MYVCDMYMGMGGEGERVSETAVPDQDHEQSAVQDGLCQVVRWRRGEEQLGQREAWAGIFPWQKWMKMGIFWYVMCLGKK